MDPTHPLIGVIKEFKEHDVVVTDLEVKPLDVRHVCELVCDTTRCTVEEGDGLAALLHNKTAGNPFYVNQLLKTFYQDGLLQFDFDKGCWLWKVHELESLISSTANVVELMMHHIRKLRPEAQHVLKLAAALGDKFTLDVLATVVESSVIDVAGNLWDSLQMGLVLPMNPSYNMFVDGELQAFSALQVSVIPPSPLKDNAKKDTNITTSSTGRAGEGSFNVRVSIFARPCPTGCIFPHSRRGERSDSSTDREAAVGSHPCREVGGGHTFGCQSAEHGIQTHHRSSRAMERGSTQLLCRKEGLLCDSLSRRCQVPRYCCLSARWGTS